MQKRSNQNRQGIDVSHWQGSIDWNQVADDGITFAFIKATEGHTFVDPKLQENAIGARRAGLDIGFYHFARFTNENIARQEARHFLENVGRFDYQLWPVLDLETTNGLDRKALTLAALAYIDEIQKHTNKTVMVYTYSNFAKTNITDALGKYPLWIAHYGVNRPADNGVWDKWTVFQYTNRGNVAGINGNVDLDVMAESTSKKPTQYSNDNDEQDSISHYTIKKGDTFWELENEMNIPHGTLQRLNPGLDPRRLQIGQTINIPGDYQEQDYSTYTIKKGDTFWELEEENGWEHGTLRQLNPGLNPRQLQIGQTIKTP